MNSIKFYVVALTMIFGANYGTVNAQVTIGDDALPRTGLVLDMKKTNPTGFVGGMMPPNVEITDLTKIPANFTNASDLSGDISKQQDLAGMLVYNTKSDAEEGITVGYYTWNGEKWKAIPSSEPAKPEGVLGTVTGRSGHSYTTYLLGNTRWMVENSKEGHHVGFGYGMCDSIHANSKTEHIQSLGSNGYYYSWEQASAQTEGQYDACPEGWVLPQKDDFDLLRTAINNDITKNKGKGIARWWAFGSAFAGLYSIEHTTWNYWGVYGSWWCASEESLRYYCSSTEMYPGDLDTGHWYSVRCVQYK